MSNNIKTSVTGIDKPIQNLQTYLYDALKTAWNLTDANFQMYGRAYRNQSQDGYAPEVLTGSGEYTEILYNDAYAVVAFFMVSENQKVKNEMAQAEVSIFLLMDLSMIYTSKFSRNQLKNSRLDEEARQEVKKLLDFGLLGFFIKDVVTGIDNVFKEFKGWKFTYGNKFNDYHSYHCFRINMRITYNIYD